MGAHEDGMEKYAVEELADVAKTASNKDLVKCPSCGTQVRAVEKTNVLVCPRCGTRPFEVPVK